MHSPWLFLHCYPSPTTRWSPVGKEEQQHNRGLPFHSWLKVTDKDRIAAFYTETCIASFAILRLFSLKLPILHLLYTKKMKAFTKLEHHCLPFLLVIRKYTKTNSITAGTTAYTELREETFSPRANSFFLSFSFSSSFITSFLFLSLHSLLLFPLLFPFSYFPKIFLP